METILDPTHNYIVLDADDFKDFVFKAGLATFYVGLLVWSGRKMKRDWNERQAWKEEQKQREKMHRAYEEAVKTGKGE